MSRRAFDAWTVPAATPVPASRGLGDASDVQVASVDAAWVHEVARRLRAAGTALRARPAREVAAALGSVGRRFLDPADPLRAEALEWIPRTSGLSAEMSAAVLDGMSADWTEPRLVELLDADLGGPDALDGFVRGERGRTRAVGPALCVQIVSGSVPGVSATALVRSLLCKAPTLVKPGLGDVALPVLFAKALREADPVLADAAAVVYWPGGSTDLEDAALAEADAVVAYGADASVRSLRDRAAITARFVAYHHRVSVGVVCREALTAERVGHAARDVARAAALFDQRGCVSPGTIYVEAAGEASPLDFAHEAAAALASLEKTLPGGTLDDAEASALHQLRGTAELLAASGRGAEVRHGGPATWTVLFDPDDRMASACVGRTVRVVPVDDVLEVPERLDPLGAHLQSVGIAGCAESRLAELAEALVARGVSRVTDFGKLPFPPPWWHHDGRGPLRALVRWADLEG